MHPSLFRRGTLGVASLLYWLLLWTGSAFAEPVIEEMIVTAEKRETSLQKTPLAVIALTSDDLEDAKIESTMDIQMSVPGLVMSQGVIQGWTYIRGIGTDIAAVGADASVAYQVDGVYVPRPAATLQDLLDVERIEVVKGPQGTLYGRNATGGVINIISKPPTNEFEAKLVADAGNYDSLRVGGYVSGPIVDDQVLGRLAFQRNERDGYLDNLLLGGTVDDEDASSIRGIVEFSPSDNLLLTVAADHSREDDTRGAAPKVVSDDAPALLLGAELPNDDFDILLDFAPKIETEQSGVTATLEWDFESVNLTSISSYRRSEFTAYLDLDGTEIPYFVHDHDEQDSKTYSQEIRIANSSPDDWEWIAGLYYFGEEADALYQLAIPIGGVRLAVDGSNETDAYALFGQASYSLTDKIRVTAGLRYSYEEKDHEVSQSLNVTPPAVSRADDNSWDAFTPKLGVEYSATDDLFLYAAVTRGFKSGGFNSTGIQDGFEPEFITSYEAGIRSEFWQNRTRVNLTVFLYDYEDLQVNKYESGTAVVVLDNAAEATVKGAELELAVIPTDRFQFSANLAYLDAEYDEFVTADPDLIPLGIPSSDISGNDLVRSPKFTTNLLADYTIGQSELGELTARVSYFYRSKMYFTPFNDNGVADVSQPAYDLWNTSLRFDAASGKWYTNLYVLNLTDEAYYHQMDRSAAFVGTIAHLGPPRTYGLQLGVNF